MWPPPGRQCAAHMAKRPFKVTRLNIVVTKDMAEVILVLPLDGPQRQKNLGSRVALLPGKFLRVRKVFARITEKTF